MCVFCQAESMWTSCCYCTLISRSHLHLHPQTSIFWLQLSVCNKVCFLCWWTYKISSNIWNMCSWARLMYVRLWLTSSLLCSSKSLSYSTVRFSACFFMAWTSLSDFCRAERTNDNRVQTSLRPHTHRQDDLKRELLIHLNPLLPGSPVCLSRSPPHLSWWFPAPLSGSSPPLSGSCSLPVDLLPSSQPLAPQYQHLAVSSQKKREWWIKPCVDSWLKLCVHTKTRSTHTLFIKIINRCVFYLYFYFYCKSSFPLPQLDIK